MEELFSMVSTSHIQLDWVMIPEVVPNYTGPVQE